ncbi:MAG: hypothetical protein JRI68_02380 [Deltaproteobacteria bacterium]|nr:hypothetical protein [Deltaproteobacteria bacterium]
MRRGRIGAAALGLATLAGGCRGSVVPAGDRGQRVVPPTESASMTTVRPSAVSSTPAADAWPPSAAPSTTGAVSSEPPVAALPPRVDAMAWTAQHGVPKWARRKLEQLEGCVELVVGTKQEPALSCQDHRIEPPQRAHHPAERVVFYVRVVVVRNRRIVPVLDVPVTVSPMVKEWMEQPDVVNTRLVVSDDGLTATLTDDKPPGRSNWVGCDVARAEVARRLAERAQGGRHNPYDDLDADFVRRVCDGLGERQWSAGHFVAPGPPGPTSRP